MAEIKHHFQPGRWLAIVNPNSGNQKIGKDWKKIGDILQKEKINFEAVFTERKGHALEISAKYIREGWKNIIIAGGDGTFNEVVNGIFRQDRFPTQDITIGLILAGTGNDWGRMYGIPADYTQAIRIIKKGRTFLQDAGVVSYYQENKEQVRYFANMAGIGYDALVAHKTNKLKERGRSGTILYLFNLVTGLFEFKHKNIEVLIDDNLVFNDNVFSMSIGICSYNGGGMKQLPNAIPDDGLLDVTLIKETRKMEVVRNIKRLYDGSFVSLPMIEVFTGKTVTVKTMQGHSVYLEADGESLGHSPMQFGIVPKSLCLIIPGDYKQ